MLLQCTIGHCDECCFVNMHSVSVKHISRRDAASAVDADNDIRPHFMYKVRCHPAVALRIVPVLDDPTHAIVRGLNHGVFEDVQCLSDCEQHSLASCTGDVDKTLVLS